MHDIINELLKRYTAKQYDPSKRVPEEKIEILKEAIRLTPSSINSQPWKFLLLESDEAKQRFHNTFAIKYQFNQHHALEASHIILFAHKPNYTREDFIQRLEAERQAGRLPDDMYDARLEGSFTFVEVNTNEYGINSQWTRAQLYLALGNALCVLARLGIDSTPMEGVDSELIAAEFADELDGYICDVALAFGYANPGEDYNYGLPKSRLPMDEIFKTL
ncbi:NAD(P)H-dependent oxidoreductase [Vibrio sp. SM6]|uniref:NAD(P)H-dependent oxidoreductase n=1 Tax=Vibrio agarilyticus TaxID=2726741 RepID=A0A7X8YGH3_9VIBR|nr:nitroreductase family protein [Vibrio agarilyticus]NLS12953.1 NAD(P)H-dependent oxidoreductase [Vibrio agarilyticus]